MPEGHSVKDTRLMARAVSQRWPMSQEIRDAVITRLAMIVADPNSTTREVATAARALISAERQNQQDDYSVPIDKPKHLSDDQSAGNRFLAIAQRLGLGGCVEGTVTKRSGGHDRGTDEGGEAER